MCRPFEQFPAWDQRSSYAEQFIELFKKPACKAFTWSPTTDGEVMQQTIAVMQRRNVYGVLSGSPERVARWRKAAPGRFLSGLGLNMARNYSPARVEALRKSGQLDVLAEVSTQYEGIEPSIKAIEDAPFLTRQQKRDILYHNAARFLRLTPEQIARHHAP